MPRSARHQASIDRHRTTLALPPKPKNGEKAPRSWWIGLDRNELAAAAVEEQKRMAPNAGIAGDKGVTY